MEILRSVLRELPEFQQLLAALDSGQSPAAVSGLAAVHRAHFAACLGQESGRPVVMVCADEGEAERMARDLSFLTGGEVPVLAARSFLFHNIATVSRQWEHRRLRLLYRLTRGEVPCLVATVEALLQRTLPPEALERACAALAVGQTADLEELTAHLTEAGYVRCEQVEGPGQFALRGGILDVYSPAMEAPVRAEFFGDEVDALGIFDPVTQRRTANVEQAVLLPAAETLPHLAPGGLAGLLKQLDQRSAAAVRDGLEELAATLRQDREALEEGRSFPAADRYLPLIYPELATAADYLPYDACVLFSESSRVGERAKTWQWQLEEDVKTLLERGELDGACGALSRSYDQLCRRLEDFPFAYLDSFALSAYPAAPRCVLSLMAKQLPSFGASLETAVQDLSHYQSAGFSVLVLVSSEQRALNLQTLLREQKVKAGVDFALKALPRPGQGLQGEVHPGFYLLLPEEGLEVQGPLLAGHQHQDGKPGALIVAQVLHRSLQAGPEGGQLLGHQGQHTPGSRRIGGQGEGIQIRKGEVLQPAAQLVIGAGQRPAGPIQLAPLQQGLDVLLQLPLPGLGPLPHPAALREEDAGVIGEIVCRGGQLRID